MFFVFLEKPRNLLIFYREHNGFCFWLKRLESERFKTSPDLSDEVIVLTARNELVARRFGLWRNHHNHGLTLRK